MPRPTRVQRRHTAAQRHEILTAYQRSQLTQKAFAAHAGIGGSTLTAWLRKAAPAEPSGAAAFVPVPNLFSAATAAPAYRLQFPRGHVVEVGPGFQSAELAALLQLVQAL